MNPIDIDTALENRLLTLPGAPSIAWEDVDFKPKTGTAYLEVTQLRNSPVDASMTQDMRRDRGIFQVTVVHPAGRGKVAALTMAQSVTALFPVGLELSATGGAVLVTDNPAIASGYPDEGWYRVPVSINWRAYPT